MASSSNYFANELNIKMNKISSMLKKTPVSKTSAPLFDPSIVYDESTLKNDEYYELFSGALMKKVETIQKDNERLVNRLHFVKKLTKRRNKDVALLKARLDTHGDNWRTAEPETLLKLDKLSVQDFLVQSSPNGNTLFPPPPINDQSCFKTPAPKRPYVRKNKTATATKPATTKPQINRQMFNKSVYNRATMSKGIAIPKIPAVNKLPVTVKPQTTKKRVYKPRKTIAEKVVPESQLMRPPLPPYTNFYKEQSMRPTIIDDLKRKYNPFEVPQYMPSTSKQAARRWNTINPVNPMMHNTKQINVKSYY